LYANNEAFVLFVDFGSTSNFGGHFGVQITFILFMHCEGLLNNVECGIWAIVLVYACMTGRMSVILAQASKARLDENSRDSKPSFVRASRSGESISPKQEIEKL